MDAPKYIRKKISTLMSVQIHENQLQREIYKWIERQGINTQDEKFADAIAVRLGNNEFDSVDHFIQDLEAFKNGEDVGYG